MPPFYEWSEYLCHLPRCEGYLGGCLYGDGGWPLNKTEYYTKAAEKAREVIAGVSKGIYEYELNPDYKDVYAMNNNYNNETVVGINYSPISDWAQDSQLTSCNLFESQGAGETLGGNSFLERIP